MTMQMTPYIGQVVQFDAPAFSPDARATAGVSGRHARTHRAGYADGYEAGLQAAEAEVEMEIRSQRQAAERLVRAAHGLEAATAELARRDAVSLAEIEQDVLELAMAIAGEILGREIALADAPVLDALTRACRLIPERAAARVRVHPDDVDVVSDAIADGHGGLTGGAEVVGDPVVPAGDCVVDVGECRIDARIGEALDRLRDALV